MTVEITTTKSIVPAEMAEKIIKLTDLKKKITEELDLLKEQLLEITQQHDVYTLKTGTYTISRGKRQTVTILDHEAAFKKLVELGNEPTMVEVLAPTFQELAKSLVKKGQLINGVTHQETEYITVKIAKEK